MLERKSTYFGILRRFSTKQREIFNQSRETEIILKFYKTKTTDREPPPQASVLNIQPRSCKINHVLFINYESFKHLGQTVGIRNLSVKQMEVGTLPCGKLMTTKKS